MNNKTICILGGSGFVGHHITNRLMADGYHIRILTRRREQHRDLLVMPDVEMQEANVHDASQLRKYTTGCSAIINLVGILNQSKRIGETFNDAHVKLPGTIAKVCQQNNIPRILHMSALGADVARGHSYYLRTKGNGENVIHQATRDGLNITSFRPSVIFGRGDNFFNLFAGLLKQIPFVFPLACPQAQFAPVYAGDVAEAFAVALTHTETYGQRYELCGPRVYPLQQLVEYTAELINVNRKIIGLSNSMSRLQARILGKMPGKPFTYDNYLSMLTPSVCQEELPRLFNIKPTPLETIVPGYLAEHRLRGRYPHYRQTARRQ